jgi:hypothetical protein
LEAQLSIRQLLIMLVSAGGLLIAPAAAQAEGGYPIEPPASSVSSGTTSPDEPVTFSGKGFLPGEPITIDISYGATTAAVHDAGQAHKNGIVATALKTVTASAAGTFSTPIVLDESGKATLTATGNVSGVTVSEQVTVVVAQPASGGGSGGGSNPGSGGTLPVTGEPASHWAGPLGVGSSTILLGVMLLFGAMRLRGRRPRGTEGGR